MEKVFRVETTLAHDLAQLYAVVMEEFDRKSSIPLGDMNRTLLQTGMLHHLTMMMGLGLIPPDKMEQVEGLVARVARDTIMDDVVRMARQYWEDRGNGKMGTIDFHA